MDTVWEVATVQLPNLIPFLREIIGSSGQPSN